LDLRCDFQTQDAGQRQKNRWQTGPNSSEEEEVSHANSDPAEARDGLHPIFSFTYKSIPFRVLPSSGATSPDGSLEAVLGILPFTVDGEDLRSNTLAIIDEASRIPGLHIEIGTNHAINLSVALPIGGASSADTILATAIEKLAHAKRFLDVVLSYQPSHWRPPAPSRSGGAA
jgi:hypothetical protein